MSGGIQKNVLSEICLYYGYVKMPKNFNIDREILKKFILSFGLTKDKFMFNRDLDKLNTYVKDYMNIEHNYILSNKNTWGTTYKPNERSDNLLEADPVDLKNSPDFTFLYGVDVKDCTITIYYDDNRRKNRNWEIPLKNNGFVMFPSTCMYYLNNKQKNSLNFIQTITYEFK